MLKKYQINPYFTPKFLNMHTTCIKKNFKMEKLFFCIVCVNCCPMLFILMMVDAGSETTNQPHLTLHLAFHAFIRDLIVVFIEVH